ncbi:hypothetical protein [Selenomonas infelix]|uniref:hypothetical protein n=1 Tax=Selenomonas infelix TaxID=135082 RepID=UPI0006815049|nr:hypothetical protein [Selenomonas infelix]
MNKVIKVAKVTNAEELVLNAGQADKIQEGDRYLVYGIGEEIFDPDTKKSLGCLEVVRGTGKVVHVQERMCTIRTDMKEPIKIEKKRKRMLPTTSIMSTLTGFHDRVEEIEYTEMPEAKPFDNPEVGDHAKPIS